MKQSELVRFILRPQCIEEVMQELEKMEVEVFSLESVSGVGRQRGHVEIFPGREYGIEARPKIRLEILVDHPGKRDEVIRRIRDVVYTGHIGDGKVFVMRGEIPKSEESEEQPE